MRHNPILTAGALCLAALVLTGCGMSAQSPTDGDQHKIDTKLAIQNLGVTSVCDTAAVLAWGTTQATAGAVRYGLSSDLGVAESRTSAMSSLHEVALEPLHPTTTYYYRVQAITATGDTVSCRGPCFQTHLPHGLTDETPPLIQDVQVGSITSSSALLTWRTDDLCRCRLHYGATTVTDSLAQEYPDDASHHSRGHATTLTGLSESTTYLFAIEAINLAGRATTATAASFTTRPAPSIGFCADTYAIARGGQLTVPICIAEAYDLAGVAVTLVYDPTVLELVDGAGAVSAGPFWLDNDGHLFMPPVIDSGNGVLSLEATWNIDYLGDQPLGTTADGDGVLAQIRFRFRSDSPRASSGVSFRLGDYDSDGYADTRLLDFNRLPINFVSRTTVIQED